MIGKSAGMLLFKLSLALVSTSLISVGLEAHAAEALALLQENIEQPSSAAEPAGEGVLLAAKRHQSKSGRSKKKGKKKGASSSSTEAEGATAAATKGVAKTAIKASAGMVLGLKGATSSVFLFGGDYVMAMGSNMDLQGGASYWYNDIISDLVAVRVAILTLGVGAGYLVPLGKSMSLEAMGKGVLAMATTTVTTTTEGSDELVTTETSQSVPGLALGASFHYDIGGMDLGPEVWYPIYFSSEAAGLSAINALFFFQLHL